MPAIQLDAAKSIRLGLRTLQFVCSLAALATVAAGFRSVETFGLSSRLGSHSTTFAILLTYTTMLFSLFDIVVVELYRFVPRAQRLTVLAIDAVFAVLLFIGGIVLATSDYVSDCDAYGFALRCNNLTAGTVFMFIACGAFICTAVLTFFNRLGHSGDGHQNLEGGEPMPYVEETTPRALSPMGMGAASPSTKV